MTPLVDADILVHELAWSGQFKDKETGEEILFPFEKVEDLLVKKIEGICYDVESTTDPILFLTNSKWITSYINRRRKFTNEEKCFFVPGFRYSVASTKPYKGTRTNPKPFHFENITMYLLENYDTRVSRGGLEADDEMCLYQTRANDFSLVGAGNNTVICSRDKDLRICPGWHYSWECGKQASVGPTYSERIGSITFETRNGKKELKGYGLKFFFAQMIMGDTADNIPGLQGKGAAFAYKLLADLNSEEELLKATRAAYKEFAGDSAKDLWKEQAQLLWMKQTGEWHYGQTQRTKD